MFNETYISPFFVILGYLFILIPILVIAGVLLYRFVLLGGSVSGLAFGEQARELVGLKRFKERIELEAVIPFELPVNLRRVDGDGMAYLQLLETDSRGDVSRVRVHLLGISGGLWVTEQLTLDVHELKWDMGEVLEHLNGDTPDSIKSRDHLGLLPIGNVSVIRPSTNLPLGA